MRCSLLLAAVGGVLATVPVLPVTTKAPAPSAGGMWAVIAAGSSGYWNYRHQADACHAFQVLRKSGVPEEHIILMMQDDVANDPSNPFPGQLFNKKGDDVTDVYKGCKVDYRGAVVTAELFLKVITGDASGLPAGSKVLKSGPNDRVFLNFVDHGGVGIIAFPNGPFLHAADLSKALQTMQQKKMFNELLFYMEACESGSMFPDLTADGKIFAVTAANADESSWGYYCMPDDDVANGKHLGTCLGDLFSIAWMEDSDLGKIGSESIVEQVRRVTIRTNKSHVSTFGDKSFEGQPVGGFVAALEAKGLSTGGLQLASDEGAVGVRDIELQAAYVAWSRARTAAERQRAWQQLQTVVADRTADEAVFNTVAKEVCKGAGFGCTYSMKVAKRAMQDAECHKVLASAVHGTCPRRGAHNPGGWNAFNMQFSQLLVNMCESRHNLKKDIQDLLTIVSNECGLASARVRSEESAEAEQEEVVVV